MTREEVIRQCYQVPGQTWPVELGWLYDNLKDSSWHVEIGTYCGRSLLASCGGMAKSAVIYSIDDKSEWGHREWVQEVQRATFKIIGRSIVPLHQNSIDAHRYCKEVGCKFDSVFIDGCHEYAECKADIRAWMSLLKPGGLVCGHDYWTRHVGVMDAVNEVFEGTHSVVSGTRIWYKYI